MKKKNIYNGGFVFLFPFNFFFMNVAWNQKYGFHGKHYKLVANYM